jgi:ABC-type amino acid transport system permease subunit
MPALWRWILAMGFSALVLFGGLVLLYRGGPDFEAVAWLLVVIGALSLAVNLIMRNRFVP